MTITRGTRFLCFVLSISSVVLKSLDDEIRVLSLPTERPADLFILNPSVDTLDVASCDNDDVISCVDVTVNPDAINAEQIMVEGVLWTKVQPLQDEVTDESFSTEFSCPDGSTAVFTARGGHMFGSMEMADGSVYLLENCGENCHVWMEWDTDLEEESDDEVDELDNHDDDNENRGTKWYTDLQNQGKEDETTIAEFSVMIYYTPEFAAETPDVRTYVDAVIAETNEGYINSKIPVRIKVHCIELAEDLHDMEDGSDMLKAFREWGGSDIRRSADVAALLVADLNYCGIGYLAGYIHDMNSVVAQKRCALGYFTFGHEVGHNFGATHDKKNGYNYFFPYGYGKHIGPQYLGGYRGWRTNMAYFAPGYGQKANYYSNPDVQFMGHDTGSADEDNAKVITVNRFVMEAMGDESQECTTTVTSAPRTQTTEAPTAAPISVTTNNECVSGSEVVGQNVGAATLVQNGLYCKIKCLITEGCNWFSYFTSQSGAEKKRGKCFLKKNMKEMKKMEGVVSGAESCNHPSTILFIN